MVDYLFVELVGFKFVLASEVGDTGLWYKSQQHPFTLTVTTITTDSFCKFSFNFKLHRTAVTTTVICHRNIVYEEIASLHIRK